MKALRQEHGTKSLWANQLWPGCVMPHLITTFPEYWGRGLLQSLVFSALLYAAEIWTLKGDDQRRIDALEMWVWQRTMRRINFSIINKIQEPVRLSILCERRILEYFGYVTWREVGNLKKDILLGKAPGKKGRGRSLIRWSDIIKAWIGSVVKAAAQTRHRDGWRAPLGAIWS